MKHIIESQQFDLELLTSLFARANELRNSTTNSLKGKIIGVLFYEPSTRTRLSFEAAALKLGAGVIGTEQAKLFSSAVKGETIEDTIRVVQLYTDAIVLRHDETGSVKKASMVSNVPLINAGDGSGQHPTQALIDMYTIYREVKRLDNLHIAIVGDLREGRTVRSLSYLLAKYKNIRISFVSPKHLTIGDDIKKYLIKKNIFFDETDDLHSLLPTINIVYMTRIQKERMSKEDYELAKNKFVIDEKNILLMQKHARILHPLPHVEEIQLSIGTEANDERVAYFRQVENGLYLRMALLEKVLLKQ